MEEPNYIDDWISCGVTLNGWLENRTIDHWEIIRDCGLEQEQITEIENHQASLFHELLDRMLKHRIGFLERYNNETKTDLIKEHLRVINLFIESTQSNPVVLELLKPIALIREPDYVPVLLKYQSLISQQFNDFQEDYQIGQKGNYKDSHFLSASVLYEYKKQLLSMTENPSIGLVKSEKNQLSETRKFITDLILEVDKTGWAYCFKTESDFDLFSNILTSYFEQDEYELPKHPIKLKNGCKTRLAKALGGIHRELGETSINADDEFLKIVRVLIPYRDDKDLYKTLTREKYY